MIGQALVFLKDRLNEQLAPAQPETVVFPDGVELEPVTLRLGAITLLLVNIEQGAAPQSAGFSSRASRAESELSLYVLFVSSFKAYAESLDRLSALIGYLQANPVLTGLSLPAGVQQLVLESVPLTLSGQNELWGALRVSLQPSALYRVRLAAS